MAARGVESPKYRPEDFDRIESTKGGKLFSEEQRVWKMRLVSEPQRGGVTTQPLLRRVAAAGRVSVEPGAQAPG